jgi:hypothetical protein
MKKVETNFFGLSFVPFANNLKWLFPRQELFAVNILLHYYILLLTNNPKCKIILYFSPSLHEKGVYSSRGSYNNKPLQIKIPSLNNIFVYFEKDKSLMPYEL